MKKKILLFLLSFVFSTSFALGLASCSDDSSSQSSSSETGNSSVGDSSQGIGGELIVPEEPAALTDPDLKDRNVYKEDRPDAFYIGKGNLLSLTVDGTVLEKTDYVINGGWLVLTANRWADLGEGILPFVFDFENYDDVTINVTVQETDETPIIPGPGACHTVWFSSAGAYPLPFLVKV